MEPYYVAAYTLYKLEYMWRNTEFDKKYKLARYQLLLACRLLANHDEMPRMNAREMEKYCAKILKVLWDDGAAERLFDAAAGVVEKVAAGILDKDKLRTQPFTDAVITECLALPEIGADDVDPQGSGTSKSA